MTDKSEMIFGVRAVIEAIQAGKEIDKILVKKDIQSDLSKELFAALKGLLIPVQRVPVERINRITRKNHQGVVAFISSVTYQKPEDLVPFLFEQGKNQHCIHSLFAANKICVLLCSISRIAVFVSLPLPRKEIMTIRKPIIQVRCVLLWGRKIRVYPMKIWLSVTNG